MDFPAPFDPVIMNRVGLNSGKFQGPAQQLGIKKIKLFDDLEVGTSAGFSNFNGAVGKFEVALSRRKVF